MRADESSFAKAAMMAATSDDPVLSMLRDVSAHLDRDPPDIFGASVSLHGARLAVAIRLLSPSSPVDEPRPTEDAAQRMNKTQ